MYFNLICNLIFNLKMDNKSNGNFLTEEKGEKHNVFFPAKITPQVTQDELNVQTKKYVSYKKQVLEYMDRVYNTTLVVLSPKKEHLYTPNSLKDARKLFNKEMTVINKQNEEKVELSTKEIQIKKTEQVVREQIHEDAKVVLSETIALINAASEVLEDYYKENKISGNHRFATALFLLGCNDSDSFFKDFETFITGTEEQKKDLFTKKLQMAKKVKNDLSIAKRDDKEYLEYFKQNAVSVYCLNELDGDKVINSLDMFKVQLDDKALEDVKKNGNTYPSFGASINLLGTMANPYYSILEKDVYKSFDFVGKSPELDQVFSRKIKQGNAYKKYYELFNEKAKNVSLAEAISFQGPALPHFFGYQSSVSTQPNMILNGSDMLKDYVAVYLENHSYIAKIKDEKGNVISDNEKGTVIEQISEMLKENKPVFLYDKLDNLKTMVRLPNMDNNFIPKYYTESLNLDLTNSSPETFMELRNQFKALDSIFSHDHDEYKAVKRCINGIENSITNNHADMKTSYLQLRRLAVNYVESKYSNIKWDKTARTYQREEFMLKLISTIDKAYPIEYQKNVVKKPVENIILNEEKVELDNAQIVENAKEVEVKNAEENLDILNKTLDK